MAESPFPEELFVPMAEITTMYPNNASTASRHPGTAGSACAVSPQPERHRILGAAGTVGFNDRLVPQIHVPEDERAAGDRRSAL